MENNTEKIKYFLYARKSSESEDRQVQSIDDQINRLKELSKNLHISIKEIITEAKSAKKPDNRPIFDDMLKRIEKGEAQGILCWQINRLSRNPIDSGKLGWMLQQNTLKCIQTIDRQYLPDDNVLLFNVESGMANQFIIDLRKNSWRGMEGKADRGWLPSLAPLGYLNDKLNHFIVEDPERFHLIRKMWDLMLTGNYTPPKIREIANNDWGFKTPQHNHRGGDKLADSTIYKMFTNIFYTGMFEWVGKTYNGNHKPMITMEEYDHVQILLKQRGRPRPKQHEFAFTGIITCGTCGSMFTASEKTKLITTENKLKTYCYYHCTKKKQDVKCNEKPITCDNLEKQINAEIQKYTIIQDFFNWALEIIREKNDEEITKRTKVYESQERSLSSAQRELDNLTKMRCRDLIDDEAFIKESGVLKDRIMRLRGEIRHIENRTDKWAELVENAFQFALHAKERFNTGGLMEKREILNALGSNFVIKDGKLSIQAKEWLIPIRDNYSALEEEYNRLELGKTLMDKRQSEALASLRLRWGA